MPINNFGLTTPLIWRSAQPDQPALLNLQSLGVKSVLKLNTETPEESVWCATAGIHLEQHPIPTFINVPGRITAIATLLRSMTANGIVLVHCERGRDRTGLVIGAYHILFEGWTDTQANAERELYGVEGAVEWYDFDMNIILKQLYQGVHKP